MGLVVMAVFAGISSALHGGALAAHDSAADGTALSRSSWPALGFLLLLRSSATARTLYDRSKRRSTHPHQASSPESIKPKYIDSNDVFYAKNGGKKIEFARAASFLYL